ncbi:MAG: ankyrin repeat domain-containing protein [Treponema sp.]
MNICSVKNSITIGKCIAVLFLLGLVFSCVSEPTKDESSLIQLIKARDVEGVKAHFNTDEISTKDTEGLSLLHIAVLEDEPQIITFLIKMGADKEELDPNGRTPLCAAVSENCFAAAKALAEQDAYLFAVNTEGQTAFHIAAEKKQTDALLNPITIMQKDSGGKSPLHHAVESRDEAVVQAILAIDKPCQDKDTEGQTPLAIAYKYPKEKAAASIAAALLRAGIKPLQTAFAPFETAVLKRNYMLRFGEGETILHLMAADGHTGFVLFLIDEGVPLNAKNASHATPLHTAVQHGHVETTEALLKADSAVNVRTNLGNTVLHLCMPSASSETLLDILLTHQADAKIPDVYGETPLHTAVRTNQKPPVLKKLIDAGCYVNERNKKGETALLLAVERNNTEQIAALIEYGADIHLEDVDKKTPFTESLAKGVDMVSAVLTEKTSMQKDAEGKTPLHIAVTLRAPKEVIIHILGQKNTINAADKAGNTPLHTAVTNNDKEVGTLLLGYGADIFFTNKQEFSPLKIALTKRGGRELWLLTEQTVRTSDNVGNTALHYAAEWNLPQLMQFIIQKGGDINAKNSNGETPLFSGVKANSTAAVDSLVRTKSGNIDITARDFLGNTALHTAVRWSSLESGDLILRYGGDKKEQVLTAKNSAGKTALHISAQRGDIPFIKLFITHNIDKNISDETGKTPLMDAVANRKEEAAFFLLEQGASPTPQDMYGKTVFHDAAGSVSIDLIKKIRTSGGNPMVRDISGATPLSLVLHTDTVMIDAVLGSDSNLSNSDGETPLHIAAGEDVRETIMQQILSTGYPINKRDRTGSTALIIAAQNKMLTSCGLLLSNGGDPFISNNGGVSAVSIALEEYHELLPLIDDFAPAAVDSAGESLLHYAARLADSETLKQVIKLAPEQLHKRSIAGEIPYDVAVRWKRDDIAQQLLNAAETAKTTAAGKNSTGTDKSSGIKTDE